MFCISLCNHGNDLPLPERFADFGLCIIGSVGIKSVWPAPSAFSWTFDGRYGIHQGNGLLRIVNIGAGVDYGKRDAFAIADKMPF